MATRCAFVLVFVSVLVASTMWSPSASLTCKDVMDSLMPCKDYLTQGGSVPPPCCSSVRALDRAANTRSARQTACECMKAGAKAYKVKSVYAAKVPSACDVNVGYAISYSTDCNSVD